MCVCWCHLFEDQYYLGNALKALREEVLVKVLPRRYAVQGRSVVAPSSLSCIRPIMMSNPLADSCAGRLVARHGAFVRAEAIRGLLTIVLWIACESSTLHVP